MVLEKNIIKKLNIEVETTSLADAFYFKDHLDAFFRNEIYPEIETILDKLQIEISSDILRFDSIPLEINISSKDSLNDIKPLILNKLINYIKVDVTQTRIVKSSSVKLKENNLNAALFFLKNGRCPWWFSIRKNTVKTLLKSALKDPNIGSKLRPILTSKNVQKRLVYQLNNETLSELVLAILKQPKNNQNSLDFSAITKGNRMGFWKLVLGQISHPNSSNYISKLITLSRRISGNSGTASKGTKIDKKVVIKHILPLIELTNTLTNSYVILENLTGNAISLNLSKGSSLIAVNKHNQSVIHEIASTTVIVSQTAELITMATSKIIETSKTTEVLEEGIIVENAGLVLLHPFLKPFFENLGFLSEGKTILTEKVPEVLATLYFLATKQESPGEHELLCEKFLCDIPFEKAIFPAEKLSEVQKDACDELLAAALSHWPALKTKNIDVLRSEFLTREGKITGNAEKEKLFIQRKTQDMLLEQLPWNLGIMRLPWKKNFVFLEW